MHIRKHLKKYYTQLRKNKYIVKFGKVVKAENLWHFNRHSIIWGITIGVICSWIPTPFHTTIAVIIAILVDCNIPLVAISIWVANPATMPIMYYAAYRVGEYILQMPQQHISFHISIKDLMAAFHEVWEPLLLGCLILGILSGIASYIILTIIWDTPKLKNALMSKIKGTASD